MQENLGEKAGYRLHFIGYTVVPIVLGLVIVLVGVKGGSLF